MKAIFLAAIVATATTSIPAPASITTLGGSFARSCYEAAESRHATAANLLLCDRALSEEALNVRDQVATYVNRGILHRIRGENIGAQSDFNRAAQLDPNEPEIWLNLGVLHYNEGRADEAIRMFAKAIELQTSRPAYAYYGRGLAHEQRGNLKAAYSDFVRAMALNPEWLQPQQELRRFQVRNN